MPHPKNINSKQQILFDEGEACASPRNTNSKHRMLFDRGEACASPLKRKFKT
jgi:hypothetical protein